MTGREVVDAYFLEHRGKLVDLAAFLDRVERAGGWDDHRVQALLQGLGLLGDGQPERARRLLEQLSDTTCEPVDRASGSAVGAP